MKFYYAMQNRLKDISTDGGLKLSALLEAAENAGAAHTQFVNDTPADGSADGIAQIVTDWTIRFLKQPQKGGPLQAVTWVEKERPGYVIHRQAQILDEEGNPAVLLRACVSLFDRSEQKIVRGTKEKLDLYEPEEEIQVKGKRKLFSMDPETAVLQKQIRYEKQVPAGSRDVLLLRFDTPEGIQIEILQDDAVMILLEMLFSRQDVQQ